MNIFSWNKKAKKTKCSFARQVKARVSNLLLVAGQIFVCKFIEGRNCCSNLSNNLMKGSSKISVPKTVCSLKKKVFTQEPPSNLQFFIPKTMCFLKKKRRSSLCLRVFFCRLNEYYLQSARSLSLDQRFLKSFAAHLGLSHASQIGEV